MKKTYQLALHYIFFITSLLFLPNNILIYTAILLINILTLDKIYYTILPLSLTLVIPKISLFILLGTFITNLILYQFTKKNRYYSLIVFILSEITPLIILKDYTTQTISYLLFILIIYSIINILNTYKKIDSKYYILPYNKKLIYLTLLLAYLLIHIN